MHKNKTIYQQIQFYQSRIKLKKYIFIELYSIHRINYERKITFSSNGKNPFDTTKFYNKKYIKKIFRSLKVNGFAHDIELVFLLKKEGIEIKELPIKWKHVDNSQMNPFLESISFFFKFCVLFIK